MRSSFALRLAAAFAGMGIAAAALTALLVNGAFGSRFSSYLESQQRIREQQLVAAIADSYTRTGGWNASDLDGLTSMALMTGGSLRVLDADGAVVWTASERRLGGAVAAMHRQMMGEEEGGLGPEQSLPIRVDGKRVGTAIVRLPRSGVLPQDVSFRTSVNRLLLIGGVAAGLVAALVGLLLARRATRPARELVEAAQAFAEGDRSRRLDEGTPDEFGQMARAFNLMGDAIQREDDLRRDFAAEVAHEVRTPLTILRSQVEAIQDGIRPAGSEEVASLHEEILRLNRLVDDLGTIASADAAGFTMSPAPTAIDDVVNGALQEFAGSFEGAGISLKSDLQHVSATVDPARIRQVIANLLSNAVKFTPSGGVVAVEVRSEGDEALIRVADSGPGIPPDELPYVFDRFFRGTGARASGSGIGLAVVRGLVLAHGGHVDVSSSPGQGATFTVRLPRASHASPLSFTPASHPSSSVSLERGGDRI